MKIENKPDYKIDISTKSGETYNSSVSNITKIQIKKSIGPGVTYDYTTMWQSGLSENLWVSIDVSFPFMIALNRIDIHSQHSGKYHEAKEVKIEVESSNNYREIVSKKLNNVDDSVKFPEETGKKWRLHFKTGKSGYVTIRGLKFYSKGKLIFPHLIP